MMIACQRIKIGSTRCPSLEVVPTVPPKDRYQQGDALPELVEVSHPIPLRKHFCMPKELSEIPA